MQVSALVDKTEQIKWWDVLDMIREDMFEVGLRWARECQHPDAQWLASLFPDEPVTMTKQVMLSVMKAQGDDPRALFICFCLSDDKVTLRQAATLGYAPAQAVLAECCCVAEQFAWLEKAVAQGDRQGLFRLGLWLWVGRGCTKDRTRAVTLWKEAAELEHRDAQFYFGELAYSASDWQRYQWWGRAAAHGNENVIAHLRTAATEQLKLFEEGKAAGRVVFEIGAACQGHMGVADDKLSGLSVCREELRAVQGCVELHEQWCMAAKAAVECWIGVGRRLEVIKDIRLVIAGLVWAQRVEWGKS